jgi:hypothetical protein
MGNVDLLRRALLRLKRGACEAKSRAKIPAYKIHILWQLVTERNDEPVPDMVVSDRPHRFPGFALVGVEHLRKREFGGGCAHDFWPSFSLRDFASTPSASFRLWASSLPATASS